MSQWSYRERDLVRIVGPEAKAWDQKVGEVISVEPGDEGDWVTVRICEAEVMFSEKELAIVRRSRV
jgi:hypothetical protein